MESSEQSSHPAPHGAPRAPDSLAGASSPGASPAEAGSTGTSSHSPSRRRQPTPLHLALALAACAVLAVLQLPVAGVPDILDPPGRLWGLWPQTTVWIALAAVCFAGAQQVYRALNRATHRAEVFEGATPPPSLMEDHRHVSAALWLAVAAVLCAVILPPMLVGQWTLQPVQMWQGLYGSYGMAGIIAAVALLAYHSGFAVLTALALACAQSLAEALGGRTWLSKVPVGGVVIGLVAAVYQSVTGGWPLFVTTMISCILLGMVHLLTGRRLRWTAPATALVLIFL